VPRSLAVRRAFKSKRRRSPRAKHTSCRLEDPHPVDAPDGVDAAEAEVDEAEVVGRHAFEGSRVGGVDLHVRMGGREMRRPSMASSRWRASATALFGVRIGGLLAVAAAQRAPADDLVLLGTSTSGRTSVRELRASFTPREAQERLKALLTEHLVARFG
jgi:hypothetical protein